MLARLPLDLLVEVCAALDTPSIAATLATCRELRHGEEGLYWAVAVRQWGATFWSDAFRRPTRRVFRSMREELWKIHRVQRLQAELSQPLWTELEFRTFWEYERGRSRGARQKGSGGR